MTGAVESRLRRCMEEGDIAPISYFFAQFLARHSGEEEDDPLALTAALVCERSQQGDVCVELADYAGEPLFVGEGEAGAAYRPVAPELDAWRELLRGTVSCVGEADAAKPLIFDQDRIYLGRLWRDEAFVARTLRRRVKQQPAAVDSDRLADGLQRFFGASRPGQPDWQKLAAALAVERGFVVISGGPGTGKTSTVLRVLALLLDQDPGMRIDLAAPTGKAAARMVESLRNRKREAGLEAALLERIPDEARTLHRLLGYDGRQGFRHDATNPLALDCLVIDEASMIDLGMMARLLAALTESARLILLGDREQLASVEAGNVLGDITGRGRELAYRPAVAEQLARLCDMEADALPMADDAPPVAEAIALLRTSYRFSEHSGIGRLARLVNQGAGRDAVALLRAEEPGDDLQWLVSSQERLDLRALDWAAERYARYLACENVDDALAVFEQTRVLCALHEGELGARALNRRIGERLQQRGLIAGDPHAPGTPVMVTANDYELALFNGDIALLWPDAQGELRAWFPRADGAVRDIPVASLPEHTPAWAMTVHKAQGSEFDRILLVLPARADSPVLSRELVYTGLTRARHGVILHAPEDVLKAACDRRVRRSSGLADALWNVPEP